MTKEEAAKVIAEKLEQAEILLNEAADIADKTGLDFSWDNPGGGGYYYVGKDSEEWSESEAADEDPEAGYWRSSSHYC